MIIGQERSALGVLNPVKLEPAFTEKFATIGDRIFDRREFQEVVLALARTDQQ